MLSARCFALGVACSLLACGGVSRNDPAANEQPCEPTASAGSADDAPDVSTPTVQPPDATETPPAAPRASCDPSSWHITASRSAEGDAPANAIDGRPETRWSTGKGQGPGQYLQIDFGGWLTLSRLALESGGGNVADYLRGYELVASKDGVTFEQVIASGTQSLPPQAGIQIVDFFATPLRALRINSIQPSGNWWSVHELNVDCYGADSRYGDALACDPQTAGSGGESAAPFDRSHWSATTARSGDAELSKAAFDGDLATSWSTGAPQTSTDWFQLDLGAVACIGQLALVCPDGAAPNAYTVEVSEDAVNYVQVAEGLGTDGTTLEFAPHSARFVRINQVGSGASNVWRIRELQVRP